MSDRRDALVVRVERDRGHAERTRFEPRDDGRFARVEEEWTGCRWRPVGREIVADVVVEGRPEAL